MTHRFVGTARGVAAVVLAALLVPSAALAQARAEKRPQERRTELAPVAGEDEALYNCSKSRADSVAVTFKPETELKDLMTWVVGFTCKNFILDPRIVATNKKLTIMAPNRMTPAEAYRVFLVALGTIGLTVVPKGKVIRIVDAGAARRDTVPIYRKGLPEDTEQVVRYLLQPSYAQGETLLQAFVALKSDTGDVQLVGSMLIVTDHGSHVRDMMSLARLIDVPKGSDGIYTIPVNHADATKLANKLGGILGIGIGTSAPTSGKPLAEKGTPAPSAAVPSKIMVDERTNTLVVASSEAGYLRLKALVERLDISLDIEGGAAIHVYRLGSAIAEELAKTMNETVGNPSRALAPGAPAKGGPASSASPSLETLGTSLEGAVRIIGDKPTNSLIVMSSGRDFIALKEVIRELDQPRRQVYIEAVILEVNMTDDLTIGSSSHGGLPIGGGDALVIGGVQTGNLSSTSPASLGGAGGLIGGLIGKSLAGSKAILGQTIPSYGILFQALSDRDNMNVLSAPSIIALDNEEAKYKVGTNIPYQKGLSIGGLTGTDAIPGAVNTNIDRIDLDLELNIKPHISIDNTVLLEVKHDSKDATGEANELGPSWTTRSFETRVLVRDQQTVVIGGLMQERESVTESKVPLLGDLPLLGYFFKHSRRIKRKTNLLVLLTPYIVKDQMDLEEIRARRVREHDEFSRSFRSLQAAKYRPKIDYGRKRGVIEEINRAVQGVEEDIAARNSLRAAPVIQHGAIEIPQP